VNLVAPLLFVGFVLAAVIGGRAARAATTTERRRVSLFLLYACGASLGAGLAQREAYPFSAWALVAGLVPEPVTQPRLLLVDSVGGEHDVDARAWLPLSYAEVASWINDDWERLGEADRAAAAAYLVAAAEAGRQRARAGRSPAATRRLGPFSAPFFLLSAPRWSSQETTPAHGFVGLRFYRETWSVTARARDPAAVTRRLVWGSW
jgi:hypothetical protein